jgi:hypothetical protein
MLSGEFVKSISVAFRFGNYEYEPQLIVGEFLKELAGEAGFEIEEFWGEIGFGQEETFEVESGSDGIPDITRGADCDSGFRGDEEFG